MPDFPPHPIICCGCNKPIADHALEATATVPHLNGERVGISWYHRRCWMKHLLELWPQRREAS